MTSVDQETKNRHLSSIRTAQGTTVDDLYLFFTLPGYDNIELVRDGKNT